jgi:DNA polymerase type B, organellar and viral
MNSNNYVIPRIKSIISQWVYLNSFLLYISTKLVMIFFIIYLLKIDSFSVIYSLSMFTTYSNSLSKNNKFNYKFTNIRYLISPIELQLNFNNYFNNFIQDLNSKDKIAIITQLKSKENTLISLGHRTVIDLNNQQDINNYIELLENKYNYLENWYKSLEIVEIIFNYTLISDKDYLRNKDSVLSKPLNRINLKEDQFKNSNDIQDLPLDNHYKSWGENVQNINASKYRVLNIFNTQNLEVISKNIFTKIINIYNKDFSKLILTFNDKILNDSLNIFKRYIADKFYLIVNNSVVFYFKETFKFKNISKLSKSKETALNILTLDVETFIDNDGKMKIYCICTYDGKNSKSYYLTDFYYIKSMILKLLNELLSKNNSGKTVYIHNSNNFDLIFLMKYLASLDNIQMNPLVRDGQFINIEIKYGNNYQYNIQLRDSYLLLPASLDNLAKAFNINEQKLEFNHKLVNKKLIKF